MSGSILKLCSYCVQKDKEIEDYKCTRAKGVKKLRSKDLRFPDYVICTITNNKITSCKFNDKESRNEDWATTYPLGSNILIKCLDDKDITNSIEKLKKILKMFFENDHLS